MKNKIKIFGLIALAFTMLNINSKQIGFNDTNVVNASDEVDSYYSSIDFNQTGLDLRKEVRDLIISTHTHYTTYDGLASAFKTADADVKKSGNIIWFYTGTSVSFSGTNFSGNTNREHVWPKDGGKAFSEKSECGSDAHHLRPTDSQLNSSRGNLSFDEVSQTTSNIVKQNGSTNYDNLCYKSSGFFYPGKGYRGATARILMYVQTRWGDRFNLRFVDRAGNSKTIGKISTLMKWHLTEPVTDEEKRRNEAVYKIQGNRNPFIDHPELASKIYCNDDEVYNNALKKVVDEYGDYSSTTPSKKLVSISLSGTPSKTTYTEGDTFNPTGLSVTGTYSDNSTKGISLSSCQWLDAIRCSSTLSKGTTSVICKYGTLTATYEGIVVNEKQGGDIDEPVIDGTYTLVTSTSQLTNGSKFVITSNTQGKVAGKLNGKFLDPVNATFSSDKKTITSSLDDATIFTLSGTSNNCKLINQDGKELTKAGSKRLSFTTSGTAWSISFENNNAKIALTTSAGERILYNVGFPRFLNYTSALGETMLLPQIYKLNEAAHTCTFNKQVIDDKYLASKATCIAKATYYYSCECGKAGSETFEAGDFASHSYEWVIDTPATVDNTGLKHEECSVCHDKRNENTIVEKLSHEHTYGEWKVVNEATCSKEGLKERYCTYDGCMEKETETIAKANHAYETVWSYNETSHYHKCSNCDAINDEASHTFVNDTCSVCGFVMQSKYTSIEDVIKKGTSNKSYTVIGKVVAIYSGDRFNGIFVANGEYAIQLFGKTNSNYKDVKVGDIVEATGTYTFYADNRTTELNTTEIKVLENENGSPYYHEPVEYVFDKNTFSEITKSTIGSDNIYTNRPITVTGVVSEAIQNNRQINITVDGIDVPVFFKGQAAIGNDIYNFMSGLQIGEKITLTGVVGSYKGTTQIIAPNMPTKDIHECNFVLEVIDEKYLASKATCIAKAKYYYSCECGKMGIETFEAGDFALHSFEWVIDEDSTCAKEGIKHEECSVCHTKQNENTTIEKKNHTIVVDEAVESTCNKTGLTEGSHCSVCSEIIIKQEITEKKAHTEVIDKGYEATCEHTGLTDGKHCSVCNEVLEEQKEIAKKDHTFKWVIDKDSTCAKEGIKHEECSMCHTTQNEGTKLEKKAHTEVIDKGYEATCEHTGLTDGKHCSVCNEVLEEQKEIAKKEHTFSWVVDKESTCKEEGIKHEECSACHTKQNENTTVAKKAHTEVIDAAKESTCTSTGLTEGKHCSVCNEVLVAQEVIAKKDHTFVWVIDEDSTCKKEGLKHEECSACHTKQNENTTVSKKAHTEVIDKAIEATCEHTGLTEGKHCSVCNEVLVAQEVIAKKEHTFGEWHVVKEATTTEEGKEERTCSSCNTTESRSIAKITKNGCKGNMATSIITLITCLGLLLHFRKKYN